MIVTVPGNDIQYLMMRMGYQISEKEAAQCLAKAKGGKVETLYRIEDCGPSPKDWNSKSEIPN